MFALLALPHFSARTFLEMLIAEILALALRVLKYAHHVKRFIWC